MLSKKFRIKGYAKIVYWVTMLFAAFLFLKEWIDTGETAFIVSFLLIVVLTALMYKDVKLSLRK